MTHNELAGILKDKFGANVSEVSESFGMPEVHVEPSAIVKLAQFLKDELGFIFLTDLCGVHFPESDKPFSVVYHFHNLEKNLRLKVKAHLSGPEPTIDTLSEVFSAANWMERETFDFYGIHFTGHPKLIRILNVEYLDYFPLRKEYPLEDPTREDKDDRYFGR